jgi:hypothetical protein
MTTVAEQDTTRAPKRTRVPTCLAVGCGLLTLGATAAALLAWWGFGHVREWAADGAYTGLAAAVKETSLDAEQERSILADLARLRDGFKRGDVSLRELQAFVVSLKDGPFFPMASVVAAERLWIEPSALSDDEKIEASIHLQRVARGMHEGSISVEEARTVLEPLDEDPSPDSVRIDDEATDEEVRALVAAAKELADREGIPVEPFEVDLAGEVREAVDSAFE